MDRVVGIVPAGGAASRIHGFFKEMMPLRTDTQDASKFTVCSEQIISDMLDAGATSVHFILTSEKTAISQYYARQHLFEGRVNFNYLSEAAERVGMPFTIDSVYEQAKVFDVVMMGMPDTVVEPRTSFSAVRELLSSQQADLALGLYVTDKLNRGGYIEIDPTTKRVISHIDKDSENFPTYANNSWAIACWTKKFTEFMHAFIANKREAVKNGVSTSKDRLIFGDVIDAAIASDAVHVVGDFVGASQGFYWDITAPDKYFELLKRRPPTEETDASSQQHRRRVFIGHGQSDVWLQLKTLLEGRLILEWDEFNRVPTAGFSTQARLTEMLENARFAFLVMTAEEERQSGEIAARDNVIHELGLFQGRLGFEKAIILLEEGCAEFSNIVGLSQIRFPRGDLLAKSEEIRAVLEREGLLRPMNSSQQKR